MKAFVLSSGGIDSTTCLAVAMRDFGRDNVTAYSIDYGQRHAKEIERSMVICQMFGINHQTILMGPQPKSNLTDATRDIPRVSYEDLGKGMSPSYHYFRNGQLLSTAAAWAVSSLAEEEEGILYTGVHAEDAANWAYADCTPEFIGAMANAIFIGTYQKLRLKAPLLELTKDDVIALGASCGPHVLNAYSASWSCYLGGAKHCGTCPTCRARKEAFRKAGVEDFTEYFE